MPEQQFPIGRRIELPGHFAEPVGLESVRPLGEGYECRVRLSDGTPDEAILSREESAAIFGQQTEFPTSVRPVDAESIRLLVESARIRLAYAHDRHFAVSLSGIRTLPHQIEAVYIRMLPQPRLRFLLDDDPGAGKTIMAGLLLKEMKLREAIEHRDTLNYLCEMLGRWGYTTCFIHGGMNPHERKRAQEQFRTEKQICVATEAAGEGINLQFCRMMINYDLPWNPTRLEQRSRRNRWLPSTRLRLLISSRARTRWSCAAAARKIADASSTATT